MLAAQSLQVVAGMEITMKITYIAHSGFMIELNNTILIFDYYKGTIPNIEKDKTIYVFASHKHADHFNPGVLKLSDNLKNVYYFLSNDIRIGDSYLQKNKIPLTIKEHIIMIGKNETFIFDRRDVNLPKLYIQTLKSTDEGVAFIVQCEGKHIYHAGDLNWWHWNGETKAYNRNMEVNYKREISHISKEHFDIAFIPLDPRLENAYDWGMKHFMKEVKADYIFPMHLWEEYAWIQKLKESCMQEEQEKVISITEEGENFYIN